LIFFAHAQTNCPPVLSVQFSISHETAQQIKAPGDEARSALHKVKVDFGWEIWLLSFFFKWKNLHLKQDKQNLHS
jgi:hypothetical protein